MSRWSLKTATGIFKEGKMNASDLIFKLADYSVTGLGLYFLYRLAHRFIPKLIDSINSQAVAMSRMAQAAAMLAQNSQQINCTAQALADNAQKNQTTTQSALDYLRLTHEANCDALKKLTILTRATNEKLDNLPCVGGDTKSGCPGERNETKPKRKSASAKMDKGTDPFLPGQKRPAKVERGNGLGVA